MDRQLSKGTLALSSLWMKAASGCTSMYEHQLQKEILSSEASYEARCEERQELIRLAASDEELASLLELEASLRGGISDEPKSIACKSKLLKHS